MFGKKESKEETDKELNEVKVTLKKAFEKELEIRWGDKEPLTQEGVLKLLNSPNDYGNDVFETLAGVAMAVVLVQIMMKGMKG